ncbi:MAG: metallophosphoesterase, partial [Acidobacteria bacterium]|nr:metallophosphoesterase [Acidobacteriota bacterium]
MKRAALLTAGAALTAAVFAVAGCSSAPPPHSVAAPVSAEAAIDTTLLLVGDAGEPAAEEPVLVALSREAARAPARTTVVFLGDNVYPLGVPAEGAPDRAEAERRLRAQVDAVREVGALAVFLPGNHDWSQGGRDGWERVKREGALVEAWGARMEPKHGCPGPVPVDLGARVRLVALDTQWWLHPFAKPREAASGCETFTEDAVLEALGKAVGEEAGDRAVVVVAHHPLQSGGPHGGYFPLADHAFPLQNLVPWLWLPLPGLGSIYPLARNSGISPQDFSGKANRHMRDALERALSTKPPLVYASGHDHSLQVLLPGEKHLPRALLVSGAGIHGDTSPVARRPSTVFARSAAGFLRIDVMKESG